MVRMVDKLESIVLEVLEELVEQPECLAYRSSMESDSGFTTSSGDTTSSDEPIDFRDTTEVSGRG
jgi:hypothetical protein